MARRGRKRKIVQREGNGRAKRSVPLQKQPDIREVAMNQPHRRGSASDRRGSPVGRLLDAGSYLTAGKSASGLYEAANRFGAAYAKWRSIMGSPRPFANAAIGSGADLTAAEIKTAKESFPSAWRALRQAGEMSEKAVFLFVIDPQPEDWHPPFWAEFGVVLGLMALAEHFGIDISEDDKAAPKQVLNAA